MGLRWHLTVKLFSECIHMCRMLSAKRSCEEWNPVQSLQSSWPAVDLHWVSPPNLFWVSQINDTVGCLCATWCGLYRVDPPCLHTSLTPLVFHACLAILLISSIAPFHVSCCSLDEWRLFFHIILSLLFVTEFVLMQPCKFHKSVWRGSLSVSVIIPSFLPSLFFFFPYTWSCISFVKWKVNPIGTFFTHKELLQRKTQNICQLNVFLIELGNNFSIWNLTENIQ